MNDRSLLKVGILGAVVATELESIITCPACGQRQTETMPTDVCQFFYDCKGCGEVLRPHLGDCCVFCSYGSVPCPPIQKARAGKDAAKVVSEDADFQGMVRHA